MSMTLAVAEALTPNKLNQTKAIPYIRPPARKVVGPTPLPWTISTQLYRPYIVGIDLLFISRKNRMYRELIVSSSVSRYFFKVRGMAQYVIHAVTPCMESWHSHRPRYSVRSANIGLLH